MPFVLGIETWVDQVQLPLGTSTRSPDVAESMAAWTLDDAQELATMSVAAVLSVAQAVVERQGKMMEQRSNSVRFILV